MNYKKTFIGLFLILASSLIIFGLNQPQEHSLNKIKKWPDYHTSMKPRSPYKMPPNISKNPHWKILENLYNQHILKKPHYSEKPRIPKIIHQVWIDTPFPEEYKPLQQTVIDNHPDWEYKLWTNKDLANFKLENQAAFDAATNPGERADIWRYEILYRYGGLYLDSDFQCLKSFDIFHHLCDFYAGTDYYTREPLIYNGLMGATPKNPIIRKCIDTIKTRTQDHQGLKLFFDIHKRTGPGHLTVSFFRSINTYKDTAVIFPATFFYAWPSLDRDNNNLQDIFAWVQPETYAIHHWGISWLDGKIPTK